MILVTGGGGYIGSQLIPRLLASDQRVRVLARDPSKLKARSWSSAVEIAQGDVLDRDSLIRALDGIEVAYYLIHSMASGKYFDDADLHAARYFGTAAKQNNVQRIIYLGGLADPSDLLSRHMRSRIETGNVLRESGVPITEFRAGVIAGPGSISFEMIRYLSEAFPFLLVPTWGLHNAQPVDSDNVLDYLIAALDTPASIGQAIEIGGPDVMPYPETMLTYARMRGLKRFALYLPLIPASLLARVADLITPVPYAIALPLTEGLCADSVITIDNARSIFPTITPRSYRESIERTLSLLDPRALEVEIPPMGWIKAEGFLIKPTDTIDRSGWTLISGDDQRRWYRYQKKVPGQLWLRADHQSRVIYFAPDGIPGFLYWLFGSLT
jgi:uncharacterized protein YbjT (DUF2867 family)